MIMESEERRNINLVNLEEDERRDRTEFLPQPISDKDWKKYPSNMKRYQQKQIYFAMLRWGGDWRTNDG